MSHTPHFADDLKSNHGMRSFLETLAFDPHPYIFLLLLFIYYSQGLMLESASSTRPADIRRISWGIFAIAYELPPQRRFLLFPGTALSAAHNLQGSTQHALRFFHELYNIAPIPLGVYLIGCMWLSIAPAISLYFSYLIINCIQEIASAQTIGDSELFRLQLIVCLWLCSVSLSLMVERSMDEQKLALGGYLRAHFLPQIAQASLRSDTTNPQGRKYGTFPDPWSFGESAPGWNIVKEITTRIQNISTLLFEILVLGHIISQKEEADAWLLSFFGILFLVVLGFSPSNGVGGAGYTFWTTNSDYHRLGALYSVIFDPKYRETRIKDGLTDSLCKEYKRTSDRLGAVKADTLSLACHLPPPWYWTFSRSMMIDYPMTLYAFTLPWSLSQHSLATMVLLQHATTTLKQSIDCLRGSQDPTSLCDILNKAKQFYETLDCNRSIAESGVAEYPDPSRSSENGMKISFKNVSFSYPGLTTGAIKAVDDVSFNIEPGQLVVVVGVNGSGKTSLLKLLPALTAPTNGQITIDDKSLSDYDIRQLRRSMAFLTQSEEIYPVSLRDNLLMGLTDRIGDMDDEKLDFRIEEAARMGGSYGLLKRLGSETILNPVGVLGQSMKGCGNGEIGLGALDELMLQAYNMKEISISHGEKQRLIASRTFMRLNGSDIRLLVVDEPTSALDPVAERDLYNRFREMRKGKTTIFVTHRFGNLVKHADLILCMNEGKVVQYGAHDDLIRDEESEYARLYNAQADSFE